jgi:MFS family permease
MASFLLLVWRVKEGKYPAPTVIIARHGFLQSAQAYFRECFTTPFYLKLYCIGLLFWCASAPLNTFIVFYATKNLGLTLDAFGKALSWAGLATIPVFLVLGPIVDRFHPLRVALIGLLAMSASSMLAFLFVHNQLTFLVLFLIYSVAQAIYWGGNASLMPRLLPRSNYGQLCSANAMVAAVGLVIAPALCGMFLDLTRDDRFVFLWASVVAALGAAASCVAYRHWIQLGGDRYYVAPMPGATSLDVG